MELPLALLALALLGTPPEPVELEVVSGTTPTGAATPLWEAVIRRRLPSADLDSVLQIRRLLSQEEQAWEELIRSRLDDWTLEAEELSQLISPIPAPASVRIVIGNRGGEDAFTHDPRTIGFDLAKLIAIYGEAGDAANSARIDRFFKHEFIHLLQKAWLTVYPYPTNTPIQSALFEIWAEGIGNYFSLSPRWLSADSAPSEVANGTLAILAPRFVARLIAIGCTTAASADQLTADLSNGRFDRKWGALPVALWLAGEARGRLVAVRQLIEQGPDGIWEFAAGHLPAELAATLAEGREAAKFCQPVLH